MLAQFFTIGVLILLSAMLPGPDFAMVTKNTVLHSRRAGLFSSLGVGTAILVHISYCALGLAIVISQSMLSHPRVLRLLNKIEKYISKILGVFLIGFGVALAFVKK